MATNEPFLVRVRPNGTYLALLVIAAVLVGFGVRVGAPLGYALIMAGGVLIALFGYPILLSTVLRVPVLVVDADGMRMPILGPRFAWSDIAKVRRSVDNRRRDGLAVLLIIPTDPAAAVARIRPWLRGEARSHLARHATPIVLVDLSLDRSLDEIEAAIARARPGSG
jgi:hypothetical protein